VIVAIASWLASQRTIQSAVAATNYGALSFTDTPGPAGEITEFP